MDLVFLTFKKHNLIFEFHYFNILLNQFHKSILNSENNSDFRSRWTLSAGTASISSSLRFCGAFSSRYSRWSRHLALQSSSVKYFIRRLSTAYLLDDKIGQILEMDQIIVIAFAWKCVDPIVEEESKVGFLLH